MLEYINASLVFNPNGSMLIEARMDKLKRDIGKMPKNFNLDLFIDYFTKKTKFDKISTYLGNAFYIGILLGNGEHFIGTDKLFEVLKLYAYSGYYFDSFHAMKDIAGFIINNNEIFEISNDGLEKLRKEREKEREKFSYKDTKFLNEFGKSISKDELMSYLIPEVKIFSNEELSKRLSSEIQEFVGKYMMKL
ncbi:MAG: hypothetical protein ACP5IV_07715 [Caldisericia bacterium]